MAIRLKIGAYVIDEAETASTSTTAGVRLLLNDGPVANWKVDAESANLVFAARVTAANPGALKTAMDALTAALTTGVNADLILEHTSGQSLAEFKISNGQYSRIRCAVEFNVGEADALAILAFQCERLAAPNTGAADIPGSVGPATIRFGTDDNGRAVCSVTASFTSRAAAATAVSGMRGGTRPSYIGAIYRMLSPHYEFMVQDNAGTAGNNETPCQVSIPFRALPSWASGAAFSNIQDLEYVVARKSRAPLPEEIGPPGVDIQITGMLQIKGEKATEFEAGDGTSVAAGAVKSLVKTVLDAIISEAKTRIGEDFKVIDEPDISPSGANGQITFAIFAEARLPQDILTIDEVVEISVTTRDEVVRGSQGPQVFPDDDGPEYRCTHSLLLVARTLQSYTPLPFIDDEKWLRVNWVPVKPKCTVSENDTRTYTHAWRGEWLRVAEGMDLPGFEFADLEATL